MVWLSGVKDSMTTAPSYPISRRAAVIVSQGMWSAPRSPPIVAASVEMGELISDEADSRGLVLLLDIHVKGVQQRSDCRGIDCAEVVGGQDLGDTRGVPVADARHPAPADRTPSPSPAAQSP